MTESENENDHFDLDHFDHFFSEDTLLFSLFIRTLSQKSVPFFDNDGNIYSKGSRQIYE